MYSRLSSAFHSYGQTRLLRRAQNTDNTNTWTNSPPSRPSKVGKYGPSTDAAIYGGGIGFGNNWLVPMISRCRAWGCRGVCLSPPGLRLRRVIIGEGSIIRLRQTSPIPPTSKQTPTIPASQHLSATAADNWPLRCYRNTVARAKRQFAQYQSSAYSVSRIIRGGSDALLAGRLNSRVEYSNACW